MTGFFARLFGKKSGMTSQISVGLEVLAPNPKRPSGRQEPPTELDWSQAEYIPLPPAPPTWEVDGRNEFHRDYYDPAIGPVFQAGFKNQHTKVVKLAECLSPEQRQGRVGETIAKAFRKLVIQRMKSEQHMAAAKLCVDMFDLVPGYVNDVDRRRFNQILAQMDKAGKKHGYSPVDAAKPSSLPLFTLSADTQWRLTGERKLEGEERPDPAFDIVAIDSEGTWLLNRSGSGTETPEIRSIIRRIDRHGALIGERALRHDIHRTGVGATGASIAIMDSDGILYVYDAALNLVAESDLRVDPRVVDHFRTIETNYWGDFKSQVRAVDVAPQGDRYLFTLADEAWCCTMTGHAVWGAVMPLRDGWKRVVGRSERYGVSHEVDDALRLFDLSLPVSPSDIKRKYRALALAHHPDRNPGNPIAAEKMKTLNRAFEVLTGIDPNTLLFEESDVTSFARTAPDHVIEVEGIRLEITMTGGTPQDWVYAASFAGADGSVYLATYSGKVILVSPERRPIVVFDLGSCPNEIIEVGRYAYFLTHTRLYVIQDRAKLAAFLDVFHQGRLLVSRIGFGLLSSKRLQWFTDAGVKVGELTTRDPIRAIHAADGCTVIQTRQHQVQVMGLVM